MFREAKIIQVTHMATVFTNYCSDQHNDYFWLAQNTKRSTNPMGVMECINCGNEVAAKYCANCGQRADVKRITLRDSLRDFWTSVVGLDGFFLRTLRDLTMRPGYVAREYIRGIRVKYFGPIAYFFFMITLLLLFISMLGLDFADLMKEKQNAFVAVEGNEKVMTKVTRWIADNIKWVLFLAVPFQAFAARYLFFRKSGYNFMENTVPVFYTTGHLFWLTIFIFGFRKIFNSEMPVIFVSILSLIYFGYTYANLMTYQSRLKSFLKGMGVYLGGQALFGLTLSILLILVIVILSFVSPEVLNDFRPSAK
jgi:hypothetical protein